MKPSLTAPNAVEGLSLGLTPLNVITGQPTN